MDPPFTKLDLVSCRNLLIYLTPELQKKLLPLFHYSLNPGGFLFLGNAETVGNFTNLFAPLAGKTRLYRRLDSALTTEPIEFPTTFVPAQPGAPAKPLKPTANLQTLADQLLLQTYSPAAVLTNDKGDILYISGRTGKYLEPAAGKANWNIFAMAREGLRYELTDRFPKSAAPKRDRHAQEYGGGHQRRKANSECHHPAPQWTKRLARDGDDRLYRRGCEAQNKNDRQATRGHCARWRNWSRNSNTPVRKCRAYAKRCRPRRRNSNLPMRNCSPPTRNCSPPTKS